MKRLILIFVSIFSIVFASQANTFTVTSNADNGAGTLRQALSDIANLNTGVGGHTIIFNAGMTITLNNSLSIYNDTDFNGITINGFVDATAGPDVIIRSNNLCGVRGFDISYALLNAKFYGLVFQNLEYGINYAANATGTALNSQIKGCYFGTDITGAAIQNGICKSGINLEQASSVTIGGTGTTLANGANTSSINSERCIFGGTCNGNTNEVHGAIRTSLGANNSIVNNYIGVSADGNTRLVIGDLTTRWANVKHGIVVDNSKFNTIDGNVISGAVGCGIYVVNFADNTTIKGNKIGTNAAGTSGYNVSTPASSFGNEACGIYLNRVSNCIIGGSNLADKNLIAANGGARHVWGSGASSDDCNNKAWDFTNQMGIYGESVSNNTILGNFIGTDVTGMLSGEGTNNIMYNRAGGIKIIAGSAGSSNNTIGGTGTNDRNVISGHREFWGGKSSQVPGCTAYDLSSFLRGGTGIILQNPATTGNTILGNYIGLAADGLTGLGNLISGIELQGAASNTIGGAANGARNYFCDNGWGIMIQEDFQTAHNKSTNNTILGNWIGLNKNGAAVGNGVNASSNLNGEGGAIALQMGANNNKIGTAVAGGGNVISGNRSGIVIRNAEQNATGPANTNTIYNNIIGLDPSGATAIPNTSTTGGYGYGIQIEIGTSGTTIPFANIIGGTAANQPNIISGNQKSGIYINSATAVTASTANSIVGNNIGTNLAGTADLGNTLQGIEIVNVSKTTITSNLISGNDQNGISLTGSSTNTIQNNTIGSNVTKTAAIPNTLNGISVISGSASNIIGGIAANEPNFIFNNGGNGVLVDGATSINNSIHQNSFSCNTLRGIVLSNGSNGGIKTATITGSTTQLTYTNPNAFATRIEIFEVDACATCPTDPTRLQGKTFIATGNLTASGTFVFTTALGFNSAKFYTAILHQGTNITTTAARNTSEFTACYVLCSNPSPSITGTTTLCEGTVGTTFTVSPITTGSIYSWTVPTGVTITAGAATSSITVTIGAAPITGNVSVTETVTGGCVGSGNATLSIKAKPTGVSAGTTQNLCSATTVNLTGSTLPSGTTGLWTVLPSGPTFGNSGNASTTASGLSAGTNYTFTWAVTNAPCTAVSNTVTINNPIKPTPSITGITTLCEGTTGASFSTTSVSGNTYAWTVPTNVTVTAGTATAAITTTIGAAPITGSVSVTESSSASCSTTASATLTIKAKPTSVSAGTTQNLCSATTVNLTGSTHAGTTGAWSVTPSGPTFTNGTSASTTANGLVAGTNYTFTWAVTNAPCAAVSATSTVNNPIKPTPSITGVTTLCEGTTGASFSTTSVSGNTYAWTVPTNVTVTAGAATAAITTTIGAAPITGDISVTESSSASCSTTANATLTIKAKPGVVSAGADQNLCSATTVNLTGTTLPSGTTGAWTVTPSGPTFTNGTSASTTANGLVAGTNYTFTWAITNAPCAAASGASIVNNPIKPTPNITGITTLCEGTTGASFSTTSVSGNTYTWTVPTGVTVTAGAATASITTTIGSSPITGDVSVTESASASCSTTANATLTIKEKPLNVSAGADQTLCASTTVNLTGSTLPSGATGAWTVSPSAGVTFADATVATTTANGLVANTDYTFTWSVTNAPCAPVAKGVVISNKPEPTISNAGASQSTCNTGDVTLAGNTPTIGTGAWTVSPTTGVSFDNATSPTAKASGLVAGTTYTFTWEITNAPCVASTSTVDVNRTDLATPTIDGGGAKCSSFDATLTVNTANAGSTYVWDVVSGDAAITSSTTASSVTVNSGLTGGVIRVKESNGGCLNIEGTASISISPDNSPAVLGDDYATCLGATILTGNVPLNGIGSWSVSPSSPTAVLTPGATPNVAEASSLVDGVTYTFVYTISTACGPDQKAEIEVTAGLPGFAVTASGPTDTLCVLTKRTLSASALNGSGNYSYMWVSSDGSFTTTTNTGNVTVQPKNGGATTYTVYVVDNQNQGCKTAAQDVKVHAVEGQDLDIPNLITPNGDNKNDIFILKDKVTGMDIIKEGSHIEVVNRWGSRVYEANNYENNWVPKELTDGMYYYHITSSCGNKEYKSWLQILGNTNN